MVFQKLPSNSKALLDALVKADNPTQELCGRWDSATGAEMDELKGIISETTPTWVLKCSICGQQTLQGFID